MGALILFGLVVLLIALLQGRNSIVATAFLGLFFLGFIRIFIDYMKDFNKSKRESRKKSNNGFLTGGWGEGGLARALCSGGWPRK